jgi:hypothetical protein
MLNLYKFWVNPELQDREAAVDAEEEKKDETPAKPDFKEISTLCQNTKHSETGEKTSYETCLLTLLEKVFELKENELEQLDKFIIALAESKIISNKSFTGGVSKFAQMIPGLAADIPYLCKLFSRCVVMPLMNAQVLSMKEIRWTPEK